MFDSKEQNSKNQKALDAPRPGDYWQEMFCPYFVVVDVKDDQYTVLSCMGGPNSYTRKDEPNARIEIDKGHWGFDYSKSMIVDRAWIERAVKYGSIDGFVADVVRSEKTLELAKEYTRYQARQLMKQLQALGPEATKYLLEENYD